ncbi:MAG: hypothetical protein AAB569_06300 [Patescibacteria group bacterium]
MFSILAFQMAIVEGFVETNITGRQGVLWINADGQIKDSPQTRQRTTISFRYVIDILRRRSNRTSRA